MSEIEQQFAYDCNESPRMLKLLALLCFILAPLTVWMTFQADSSDGGLLLIGKGGFAFIPAPMVPWVMRGLAVLMVWGAWLMYKGANQQKKLAGRIAFTRTGMIWEAGPVARSTEIKYNTISHVRQSEKKRGKVITFSRAGLGKSYIASWKMRSVDEFDAMAGILTNRVRMAESVAAS